MPGVSNATVQYHRYMFHAVCSWSSRQSWYFAVCISGPDRTVSLLSHLSLPVWRRCLFHERESRSKWQKSQIPSYWCLFGRCVARTGQPFQQSLRNVNSLLRKLTNSVLNPNISHFNPTQNIIFCCSPVKIVGSMFTWEGWGITQNCSRRPEGKRTNERLRRRWKDN